MNVNILVSRESATDICDYVVASKLECMSCNAATSGSTGCRVECLYI